MDRSPLVLLPGLLCDEAVWAEQREALNAANCVVPVYGLSDSIEGMARGVLADIDNETFAVAGHSMGGRVALEMARLAPERITHLALLDSGLDSIAAGAPGEAERSQRLELLTLARSRGMDAMARVWARGMMHPRHTDGPLFEQVVAMVTRHTPDVYAAQIRALLRRPDAHGVFSQLRCPVLLACGRQDNWSPLSRHEQMRVELPSARLVVIEDAGHMSTMEQPAAVSRALNDWLAGVH